MSKSRPVVLYFDPNQDVRDLYVMKMEADFNARLTEVDNEAHLIDIFSTNKNYDLIVASDLGLSIETPHLSEFLQIYQKQGQKIPLVLMAEEENLLSPDFVKWSENIQNLFVVKRPIANDDFLRNFTQALNANTNQTSNSQYDDKEYGIAYSGIKIKNFVKFGTIPCDAYIRLSKSKFIKLIHKEDSYVQECVNKYMKKNVEKLYVKNEDYPRFADAAIRSLLALYDKKRSNKNSETHTESLETIHQSIKTIGISEEVAILTKKTIESSMTLVRRSKDIGELLNKMKKNGDYLYEHSLMVSYISTSIAKNTEWGSDATAFKLSLAAMMHDMTLEDHKMARIKSLNDPALKEYPFEKIELFKNHPNDAAKLISANKEFPPDVDFIVAQHHERPDGSGFPRGLSKIRIAPLSCVFILAHELVSKVYDMGGDFSKANCEEAFTALEKEGFNIGNFKKPFEGLARVFNMDEFGRKGGAIRIRDN